VIRLGIKSLSGTARRPRRRNVVALGARDGGPASFTFQLR
jgi:hypothetical protein